jgi:hypothetical protein
VKFDKKNKDGKNLFQVFHFNPTHHTQTPIEELSTFDGSEPVGS